MKPIFLLSLLLLLLPAAPAAHAQTAAPDTAGIVQKVKDSLKQDIKTPVAPKPLSWKPVVIPAALITYGVLEFKLNFLKDVNLTGRKWASNAEDPDHKTSVDNYTIFVPALAVYGLNIAGVKGKNNML